LGNQVAGISYDTNTGSLGDVSWNTNYGTEFTYMNAQNVADATIKKSDNEIHKKYADLASDPNVINNSEVMKKLAQAMGLTPQELGDMISNSKVAIDSPNEAQSQGAKQLLDTVMKAIHDEAYVGSKPNKDLQSAITNSDAVTGVESGSTDGGFLGDLGMQAKIFLNQLAGNAFGEFAYVNEKGQVVLKTPFDNLNIDEITNQAKGFVDEVVGNVSNTFNDIFSGNEGDPKKGWRFSNVDPSTLEVNQYKPQENRPGTAENLAITIKQTDPVTKGQDVNGQLSKKFTSDIETKRAEILANSKTTDKVALSKLLAQRADLEMRYALASNDGKVSTPYSKSLEAQLKLAKDKVNDALVGNAFPYTGPGSDKIYQKIELYNQLKSKQDYGQTLTSLEKSILNEIQPAVSKYNNYSDVRNMLLNKNISNEALASSAVGAICFINVHSSYLGADLNNLYWNSVQNGSVGLTNNLYRGYRAPALGAAEFWSGSLNTIQNPASGNGVELSVTRNEVDKLNNSKANNAIVFVDTDGDGSPNHWQRIVRGANGIWYDANNNRESTNKLEKFDFSKAYKLRFNDSW
ncbi:hypothetical protein, partial [Leptospira licerasiae]|uniref:hypothetical protein n=1 Tax=Leptospira licerasiae TaxID=447106 RepID=UPI003017812C